MSAAKRNPWRNKIMSALALIVLLIIPTGSYSKVIVLDDFSHGLSPKWERKSIHGETVFSAAVEDGRACVMAHSDHSASCLAYEIEYDPRELPIIEWTWKVERALEKGDATKKEGNDYPARLCVVFKNWIPWKSPALNYIWANRLPVNQAVPHAHGARAMMIAVESGNAKAGQWVTERRNIYEDYLKHFGPNPPKVSALAVMTDSDNTGGQATAWFGPIYLKGIAPESPR